MDTSSILFALSKRIDVFDAIGQKFPDYEIIISEGIVNELKRKALSKSRNCRDARTALTLLSSKKIRINMDDTPVDAWIIREAAAGECLVCTNDTKLRKILRSRGVSAASIGLGGQFR